MPVYRTPSVTPSAPGLMTTNQSKVPAELNKFYDKPMPLKRRSALVAGGQNATLQFQIFTREGVPADLTIYGIDVVGPYQDIAKVVLRLREAIALSGGGFTTVDPCTIVDPSVGTVLAPLPVSVVLQAGVYHGEFGIIDYNGKLAFTNKVYIWVDRGLWSNNSVIGPPQIDEIRTGISDTDPSGNLLIDDLESDLTDIAYAMEFAVRYWNTSQPPTDTKYDTTNFPGKDQLINGIVGILYTQRASSFLRNHLPASAAGLSVDDQNKFQLYYQRGEQLLAEYKEWVKQKKTEENMMAAITSMGSPYDTLSWPTNW